MKTYVIRPRAPRSTGRSAFSPSLGYPHRHIPTAESTKAQTFKISLTRGAAGPQEGRHPAEPRLDSQSVAATSFPGEFKTSGLRCRIKTDGFGAEQKGFVKVWRKCGKRTWMNHSVCQLASLQLKYCCLTDISQVNKCLPSVASDVVQMNPHFSQMQPSRWTGTQQIL